MTPSALVEPFFFSERTPLYGCLCRANPRTRQTSVLLCYPWGDEYQRFHRAFRQLSLLLNSAGFDVLRFDWSGCGDSAGDAAAWSLERWREDALVAAAALQQRLGPFPTAVVGLRLGATVAALAAPVLHGLRALVLWDPVVDGPAYLREARELQRTMLARAHALARPPGSPMPSRDLAVEESLGFPLPTVLQGELEAFALPLSPPAPGVRCLTLNTRAEPAPDLTVAERLDVPSPDLWIWREAMAHTIVPRLVLERIVAWLSGVCP